MRSYPFVRRWLSAGLTVLVFAGVLGLASWKGQVPDAERALAEQAKAVEANVWPLFGGSLQRNMVNTFEKNIPTEWSVEEGALKNVKWVASLGSKAYGGPVIAGGKIFVGTNNENPRNPKIKGDKGVIMCFDEKTGKFLWQLVHDKLPAGLVNDWPREGICSSPVVEGNRLYYVSNRCEVVCADTEGTPGTQEGKIIWKLDMIGQLGVFPHNLATCSPLIAGDLLFVITSNGVDEGHINIPKPEAPSFLAIEKKSGKVVWHNNFPSVKLVEQIKAGKGTAIKELVDKGEVLMHGQWSNPVYTVTKGRAQVLFPGGDGWIYSFDPPSGKLLWKFDCNPKNSKYVLGGKGTRNDFVSTPVIWEDKLYIGVGQDPEHDEGVGHLWCVDLVKALEKGAANKDGDVSPVNDNFDPKDPVNKNSALLWHYGGPGDPKKLGRNYYFGRTLSTCAVHDGLLYTGELAGYVHCLDARTGEKYWEHNMKAKTWSSPSWVDGKVYFGNDDKVVYVFAHGKKKNVLAEIEMDGKVRATPVAVNGTLYVMTENKLYAIANK
jgi:outer membrane protein assembly factor BamB